jgi:hypothetical protein
MMFAPRNPSRELLRHVRQHEVGGTAVKIVQRKALRIHYQNPAHGRVLCSHTAHHACVSGKPG